jgi:hypothetical protein
MALIALIVSVAVLMVPVVYLAARGRLSTRPTAPDLLRAGAEDGQPDAYRAARSAHGKSAWMLPPGGGGF